jgi:4-hydroxyphenylpyruvate dioxygenase
MERFLTWLCAPNFDWKMARSSTSSQSLRAPAELMTGLDHLELWVGNARAFCHFLMSGFGFRCVGYRGPETGSKLVSYALDQGSIRLVVTSGLDPDDEVCEHVRVHGDGVRTLAFETTDVEGALRAAGAGGAEVAEEPVAICDQDGILRRSAIAAYGETLHAFVDRHDYAGAFAPGFSAEGLPQPSVSCTPGLEVVDHVVANVEGGRLDSWVEWHERVLGLEQMRHFDADQVSTRYSALRSTVMWNRAGVVLPLNEPAPGLRRSQIQEYLDSYKAPGIQHIALRTDDIASAVKDLRRRGVRFLVPPKAYYEDARERCPGADVDWGAVADLGILVDVDSGGTLLQVFTETLCDRPTVFVEVIERRGASGFGEGNFKALFEAIEREQARRGNL